MIDRLKVVSVILVETVILLIVVNVAIAYLVRGDRRELPPGHPVYNDSKRPVFEQVYGRPIAEIRQIVGEAWVADAWIYEPYLEFRERPRRGRFVNVSPDGFRLNAPDARAAFDPALEAVFILGGSTTFGYGVRDEDTIAAHLEALLHERLPGRTIAVYNYGRGYYASTQELLLLKSLVQRGAVPRVAIFMDGLNEQFCPEYSTNLAEMFRIAQRDRWAALRAAVASLPVVQVVRPGHQSDLARNALYRPAPTSRREPFECHPPEARRHRQLLDIFVLNKRLIRSIGQAYGFDTHFILQPVGGYRNRLSEDVVGNPFPDRTARMQAFEETLAGPDQGDHSFTDILDGYQGPAFVDNVHYTSGVHRLIAQRIAPFVIHSLTRPGAPASRQAPGRDISSTSSAEARPAARRARDSACRLRPGRRILFRSWGLLA